MLLVAQIRAVVVDLEVYKNKIVRDQVRLIHHNKVIPNPQMKMGKGLLAGEVGDDEYCILADINKSS